MNILESLPQIYSFTVTYRATHNIQLPPFKGSAIRGLLGRALKDRYCYRPRMVTCLDCDRKFDCMHSYLLMGIVKPQQDLNRYKHFSNYPQTFSLEFPKDDRSFIKKGGLFTFRIHLLQPAVKYLLIWLQAFCDLSNYPPDKKSEGRFEPQKVVNSPSGKPLFKDSKFINSQAEQRSLLERLPPTFYIDLVTPLRIKSDGKPCKSELNAAVFTSRMISRINLLNVCYAGGALLDNPGQPFLNIIEQNLYWTDIDHRSSRQNTKLKMGGLKGKMKVQITDQIYAPLIHFISIFGLGSYATAGYGKLKLLF